MTIKEKYLEMKAKADFAYEIARDTQGVLDWEWFLILEEEVADFALEHEKEIWDE